MDFALSDEQIFLQEAARDALGRVKTVEAARAALAGTEPPDLWPTATTAGWTGLLVAEDRGGAGLGALEAMLVAAECGRVLASIPLLGHLPASALISSAAGQEELAGRLAAGEARAAYVPTRPPGDLDPSWTVEARSGLRRAPAPSLDGDAVAGEAAWVPDAPGADVLVVVTDDGRAVLVDGAAVEATWAYDATRPLGHVRFDGATATALDVPADAAAGAWHLTQALLAAESLGAVEESLRRSVQYAKERFTFGRAIGSYQAVKHALVEVLRQLENARSLMYYAGWAGQDAPGEFALAASAARVAAGQALDFAARELISVHGGIGATWEHDAPLFFRRAQLSRRLAGGLAGAKDRVAGELLTAAAAA
jgi:alkylation response protein AidB-like acyl-CoA dehydrogenase